MTPDDVIAQAFVQARTAGAELIAPWASDLSPEQAEAVNAMLRAGGRLATLIGDEFAAVCILTADGDVRRLYSIEFRSGERH